MGKFVGSTRSFVPWTRKEAGPAIRAPTRSSGTASGAMSKARRRILGDPKRNCRLTAKLRFPVALNTALERSRSVAGWRTWSRFTSSYSFARETSAGRMPGKSMPIRVTVTAPLSTSNVAANIGVSVCHCVTFLGFTADHEVARRLSIPSTICVRTPGRYVSRGKFAAETLSGGSTVTYPAPTTPAPIQSPGTALRATSYETMRFFPGPAGTVRGLARVRTALSGLPPGALEVRKASRAVFSCPSPSASRQRETRDTSPGREAIPETSTRTLRRLTEFVTVETLRRRIGTSLIPGSTVGGARFAPRTVRVSPGAGVPGGRNLTANEFSGGDEEYRLLVLPRLSI